MLGCKQIIRGSSFTLNCSQVLIINNDIEFEDKLWKRCEYSKTKKFLVVPKMMYFDKPDHIWYG